MTPSQQVIRSRNAEIARKWTRARFRRLAFALELTDGELGDMAYINPSQLRKYLKDNKFPAPIAGHLENIERYFEERVMRTRTDGPTGQEMILFQKAKEMNRD